MKRFKLVLMILLLIIVIVVILQNTEIVETRFLFLSFTLPRAILLLLFTVLGFIGGLIFSTRYRQER